MQREGIEKIIPHREDMLLLDEAENRDGVAHGRYTVRGNEFFLRGHFPGNPVVPGVVLCEILAQSACVLLEDVLKDGQIPMYAGLDKVRFRSPVRQGDTIETQCAITRTKHPYYFAKGSASVDGKTCVTAEFFFAVTEV